MKIPRKLGLSFLTIIATAAVVMMVLFGTIMLIRQSTDRNNFAQTIYAKALTLETAILRQNSQFRGFLVTGDVTYLKSYEEARKEFDGTAAELDTLLTDPVKLRQLDTARRETLKWRRNWGDRLIGWVKAGRRDEAQQAVRDAGAAVLVSKIALPLRDLRAAETQDIESAAASQEKAILTALIALAIGGIALIGVAITLSVLLSRQIARPITLLTDAMAQLASGRHDIVVEADRTDELGDMARAVAVFRDTAAAKVADDADREAAMTAIGGGLHRLSDADLTVRIADVPQAFRLLSDDFNTATASLSRVLGEVRGSVQSIKHNSGEINQAALDLAQRTEQEAAALQESAAALDEVTKSIREGAGAAIGASSAMAQARTEAERGGTIVRQAIDAIVAAREEGGGFTSLFDFCCRVDRTRINKRTVEALVKAGAFDALERNRAALVASIDRAYEFAQACEANAHQGGLFDGGDDHGSSTQEPELVRALPWGIKERLTLEKTAVGFYLSGHLFDEVEREVRQFVKRRLDELMDSREPQLLAGIVSDFRAWPSQCVQCGNIFMIHSRATSWAM